MHASIALIATAPAGDGGWLYDAIVSYGPVALTWALTAFAAIGSWLLARLGAQRAIRGVFEELGMHARDVVQEVWQVYVEGIKAGRADGELTPSERDHARAMAIAKLKQRLTLKKLVALGGGWLAKIFGGDEYKQKVEDIVAGAVETAVAEAKRDARAVGITTSGKDTIVVLPAPLPTDPPPSVPDVAPGGPPISPR